MRDRFGMFRYPFDPVQVYRNRTYVGPSLSKEAFRLLNEGLPAETLSMATCGCIDALNSLPAGAMHSFLNRVHDECHIVPNYFYRSDMADDIGPEQRRARLELVKKRIDELVSEK